MSGPFLVSRQLFLPTSRWRQNPHNGEAGQAKPLGSSPCPTPPPRILLSSGFCLLKKSWMMVALPCLDSDPGWVEEETEAGF